MDTAQAQVMEKVKKLLALAASPSEAEATAALAKASVLLAKYGLSMAEVRRDEEVQEAVLLEKKRLRVWESILVSVICKATFTTPLHYRTGTAGRLLLIGREVNMATARELFAYLHELILILGRTHSAQIAHVESFRQGLAYRIGERLSALYGKGTDEGVPAEDETRALVVQADATAKVENSGYIRQKYGKPGTRKVSRRVEPDSYYRGRAVGDTVNLDRQITANLKSG